MDAIIPYLVFPGTCKEAMEFYKEVLNGEITSMQTFEDSPINAPDEAKNRIFNSDLRAGDIHIKASDDLPSHGVKNGSNISLYLTFSDKTLQNEIFEKLAKNGKVLFPIENNFGMLKDKYEIQWMLACIS